MRNGNMTQLKKAILILIGLTVLMIVMSLPAMADYTSRVNAFVNNPKWSYNNGTHYWGGSGQLSVSPSGGNGCWAYAADFAHETWSGAPNNFESGTYFDEASDIRDGDVIVLYGWDDSEHTGQSNNYYAVLD